MGGSTDMTFKKNGTDPTLSRVAILPGLPGGPSFPSWLAHAARVVQDFVQAATAPSSATFYDGFRYRRSGRSKNRAERQRRRNMLHVSRRVRHKHRLARKAA